MAAPLLQIGVLHRRNTVPPIGRFRAHRAELPYRVAVTASDLNQVVEDRKAPRSGGRTSRSAVARHEVERCAFR